MPPFLFRHRLRQIISLSQTDASQLQSNQSSRQFRWTKHRHTPPSPYADEFTYYGVLYMR